MRIVGGFTDDGGPSAVDIRTYAHLTNDPNYPRARVFLYVDGASGSDFPDIGLSMTSEVARELAARLSDMANQVDAAALTKEGDPS